MAVANLQAVARERILQQPVSPDTVSWDNPFPTFNTKKKEEQKKHSSLEKNIGDTKLGDSRPPERPHTSHGHQSDVRRPQRLDDQRRGDEPRPQTSHGHGRSEQGQRPFSGESAPVPPTQTVSMTVRKPVAPRLDPVQTQQAQSSRGSQGSEKELPMSPRGNGQGRRSGDRTRRDAQLAQLAQLANPELAMPPKGYSNPSNAAPQERQYPPAQPKGTPADANRVMPGSEQRTQSDWQNPAGVGNYYGPPDRNFLDPRPASATDGRPAQKPNIPRAGSDDSRPTQSRATDPLAARAADPRYQDPVMHPRNPPQPTQQPQVPSSGAGRGPAREVDELHITPFNAAPAAKPAYQKPTYQPTQGGPVPPSSISPVQSMPTSASQSSIPQADPALGQFAFGLPSGPKSAPQSGATSQQAARRSPPKVPAPIQPPAAPYNQQMAPSVASPVGKGPGYNPNAAFPASNRSGNGRPEAKSNGSSQQVTQPQQSQYPPNAQRGPVNQSASRGQPQFPPRGASRSDKNGVPVPNPQPQYDNYYDQQYQQGYDNNYNQGYAGYGDPAAEPFQNPQSAVAPGMSQPNHVPPTTQGGAHGKSYSGRPQAPQAAPYAQPQSAGPVQALRNERPNMSQSSLSSVSDQRRSPPETPMSSTSSMTSASRPIPVRPGLNPQNETPAVVNDKPLPVRQYDQQAQSQPPPPAQRTSQSTVEQQKRISGPITAHDLTLLQQAVRVNPQDYATGLKYAKKLVEAASVLANEGGKADAKTTAKNRENYIFDAHRQVKKLVGAGYSDAMFYLADCYGSGGLGLEPDPREAFNLYQSAAKIGHAQAAYRVAVCSEMGNEEGGGTKRDAARAVTWYTHAAKLGDPPAMYKIGMILLKGLLGQQQNRREGLTWLKRATERADAENPHALHEMGLLYETAAPNDCVIRDLTHARELFEKAARLGYKPSQFRLASAFEYGGLDCPIDARQSIMWYTKAAAQGEHQSELALSGWYLTGSEGILQQSDTEAYLWARKAAASGLAKAEYAMGYFTEVGIGVAANVDEAKKWYWRAAGKFDVPARFDLLLICLTAQNMDKARERLEALKKGGAKMQKTRVSRSNISKQGEGECIVM